MLPGIWTGIWTGLKRRRKRRSNWTFWSVAIYIWLFHMKSWEKSFLYLRSYIVNHVRSWKTNLIHSTSCISEDLEWLRKQELTFKDLMRYFDKILAAYVPNSLGILCGHTWVATHFNSCKILVEFLLGMSHYLSSPTPSPCPPTCSRPHPVHITSTSSHSLSPLPWLVIIIIRLSEINWNDQSLAM